MTTDDEIQRRKHVRVAVSTPVVLKWPKSGQSENTLTQDLSGGGMRCTSTHTQAATGDSVTIELALPGYFEKQIFNASVVFCKPQNEKIILGLQFSNVPPKIEQAIIQFCFQTEILNRQDKSLWSF